MNEPIKTLNINADALLEKFERGEVRVVHDEAKRLDGGEVEPTGMADSRLHDQSSASVRIAELEAENAELEADFARVHRQADDRIKDLERQLAYERSWKEQNAAEAEKLIETVEKLSAAKSAAEARLEQFARDIAHKLGISYEPPVAKGECAYLAEMERLKELRVSYLSRAEAAEARLNEAQAELRDWIENRGPKLAIQVVNEQVAEANSARETLSLALEQAIAQRDEADIRAEKAEADAGRFRAALEQIEKWTKFYLPLADGSSWEETLREVARYAQAALSGGAGDRDGPAA